MRGNRPIGCPNVPLEVRLAFQPHRNFISHLLPISFRPSLRNKLNDTTSLLDLLLGQLADPPGTHNDGHIRNATLAKKLGVAERQQVDDGDSVLLAAGEVGLTLFGGDEAPELRLRRGRLDSVSRTVSYFLRQRSPPHPPPPNPKGCRLWCPIVCPPRTSQQPAVLLS